MEETLEALKHTGAFVTKMTTSSAVVPSLLDADGGGTAPQIAAKQHGEIIQSGIKSEIN